MEVVLLDETVKVHVTFDPEQARFHVSVQTAERHLKGVADSIESATHLLILNLSRILVNKFHLVHQRWANA